MSLWTESRLDDYVQEKHLGHFPHTPLDDDDLVMSQQGSVIIILVYPDWVITVIDNIIYAHVCMFALQCQVLL